MCGRFSLYTQASAIKNYYDTSNQIDFESSYNIAPSQDIITILNTNEERVMRKWQWGLVPPWAKDTKKSLINARGETLYEKPAFKKAASTQRCIIPANGFYEWQKDNGKQPYYISDKEETFLSFAGIYAYNPNLELYTVAIITLSARDIIKKIHNRMPFMLKKEDIDGWLSIKTNGAYLVAQYQLHKPSIKLYPVSSFVNSPKNNSSWCIKEKI